MKLYGHLRVLGFVHCQRQDGCVTIGPCHVNGGILLFDPDEQRSRTAAKIQNLLMPFKLCLLDKTCLTQRSRIVSAAIPS